MTTNRLPNQPLATKRIVHTWWPLAASWFLMSFETPIVSAFVSRLVEPKINLAAYGGIVFPLALIIESPIIMLLAASTALSKDWDSYLKVRRFMMRASAALTALHALIAFTPLYYFLVVNVIGAPAEVVEPSRFGFMLMLPWTWSIAYRRFNQGVLIRFGHSKQVGLGTAVRLASILAVSALGYWMATIPGAMVAAAAVTAGVIGEAIYIGVRVQPVLRHQLRHAPTVETPLTLVSFLHFYLPLAMTSLLILVAQPIGSAALSRMPGAIESLAVWPVLAGLLFLLRSAGLAYNEVTVALLDEPRSLESLRRFAVQLSTWTTVPLLLIAVTPLAQIWFEGVVGLSPALAALAYSALWMGLPLPALSVWQNWFQGVIVHGRQTRSVTEAVLVFLAVNSAILWAGVVWRNVTGLYIAQFALTAAVLAQVAWLWKRSRSALQKVAKQEEELGKEPVPISAS
jgi:hypothetical protein